MPKPEGSPDAGDGPMDTNGGGGGESAQDATGIPDLSTLSALSALVSAHPMTWGSPSDSDKPSSSSPTAPFVVELDDSDIQEIEHHALPRFKKLGLNGDEVNRRNFDLPAVKYKLERAAAHVHHGCGVAVVTGPDWRHLPPEDKLTLFLAVSDYIGDVRGVQTRKGDMITHITDARQWKAPYSMRHGVHTNADLPFHNDMGADILALQVRDCAEEGGHTYVASAGKIFCELAARRPDIIETLSRAEWPIQVSASPRRFAHVPLLQWHHGRVMISLDPGRLGVHPAMGHHFGGEAVPPLTPSQQEALAMVSSIATEHCIPLDTRPGDIVYLNNWALLHARSSYKDCDSEDGPRRHLVRLWLRNSALGWDVPGPMRVQWEAAFGPDGMGDTNSENGWRKSEYRGSGLYRRNYPVMPAPEYKVPKYTSGSAAFVIDDDPDSDFND